MKLILCGKGGSGKSTVTALLAKSLAKNGYNILVIDADESNLGLPALLGLDSPVVLMDHLGGKKGFREKSKPAFPGGAPELFRPQMTLDEIDEDCISRNGSVAMISIGKIHTAGEGCACPMGVLSKMILSRLIIGENDIILIDTTAGVEHFGRGLDTHCDMILGIIDPTRESVMLAEKMFGIAEDANLDIAFILNKTNERVLPVLEKGIRRNLIIAELQENDTLFISGLDGNPVDPGTVPDIQPTVQYLCKRKESSGK